MFSLERSHQKHKTTLESGFQHIGEILPTVLTWIARRAERRELGLWLLRADCPIPIIHRLVVESKRAA